MAGLIRSFDWSKTAIGPIESWSPALRMMVGFMLANRFPLLLWWGPTFCSIYNDPYRPVLGVKHPWALGKPVSECWSEIWHVLKPLIETPFNGGPPTWMEDIQLEINRYGFLEETHFTVAYSPVPDETAPRGIGGVLATVHEISEKVVGERRVAALRDLGVARRATPRRPRRPAPSPPQTLAARTSKDVPFVLLYLIDAGGERRTPRGGGGVAPGEDLSPLTRRSRPRPAAGGWPLAEARRREALVAVERLARAFQDSAARAVVRSAAHRPRRAPSRRARPHEPVGFLVAGVERAPQARRRLPRFPRAGARAARHGDRQRARLRGGEAARRGAGRDRSRQDGVLLQREPRVPHAAHPDAGADRGRARRTRRPAAARRPRAAGGRAPQRPAPAAGWSTRCSISRASRPGRVAGELRADRPRQRSPPSWRATSARRARERACGSTWTARPLPRAGLRRPRHVGEDRPEPPLQRLQVHLRGRASR